jgi:hypothetical protein
MPMERKPEGRRCVGRPTRRWKSGAKHDLKKLKIKNLWMLAKKRGWWTKTLMEAETHNGL